eukprot:CAMPEP_0197034878 /NCGR_PEP_ID=MMETSP1384-20130603/12817_1 /TAXON_ID=29189 /ORGANISM="Ammonia sp." /LENGTH=688 /DNA_ID=CAMNT_0042464849 /DNA_START=1 /DNA_END=2067 /DNA_ORIENTATION=-
MAMLQSSLLHDQPPLKKRKLNPSASHHGGSNATASRNATDYPPYSPSPPPPLILLQKQQQQQQHPSPPPPQQDDEYDSDISGMLDIDNTDNNKENGHSVQQNGHGHPALNDIEIALPVDHATVYYSDLEEVELSPSPPWGRSPSPPPSPFFHKPTKKKSRWDERNENAASLLTDKRNKNGMHSSLIHSINLQQQKQKKVEPLLLDEHGNALSSHGDEYMEHDQDASSANAYRADLLDDDDDADTDEFWDEDIVMKPPQRSSRQKAFKFVEQGTYTQKAESLRKKELHKYKGKSSRVDIDALSKKMHDDEGLEWLDPVPNVEWWDAPLLSDKNDYSSPYKKEMVTDLIENPRILRPELLREGIINANSNANSSNNNNESEHDAMSNCANNNASNSAIPWILTKKERKKMKRMKKKEEHQRRTDEIRLGLREPPEPRLKLSNIFRVLGAAAIRDPTAAESIARAQTWKRKMKHELHNANNQLTAAQRREKKKRKLQEDTSKEVHVSIFVVYDLFGKLNKTKICLNAQQRNLTGALIMLNTAGNDGEDADAADGDEAMRMKHEADDDDDAAMVKGGGFGGADIGDTSKNKKRMACMPGLDEQGNLSLNMVIAEGGPKGISKYQRLLEQRIKWNGKQGNCQQVWQGIVAKRAFQKFHQMKMKTEGDLKKFLKMHNVLSYWDMVKNSSAVTCV